MVTCASPGCYFRSMWTLCVEGSCYWLAAGNKQKEASCQNRQGGEGQEGVEEEEEEGEGILGCTDSPHPLPNPPTLPFLSQETPSGFGLETRSLISSLHVALGCPGLIIPLITLPLLSTKHKYHPPRPPPPPPPPTPSILNPHPTSLTVSPFLALLSFSPTTHSLPPLPHQTIRGPMMQSSAH